MECGTTTNLCGHCIAKNHISCEVCGDIESLQSAMDVLQTKIHWSLDAFKTDTNSIYRDISNICVEVSSKQDGKLTVDNLNWIQERIDYLKEHVEVHEFRRFTEPESLQFNECRVRCRKLERSLITLQARPLILDYINKLSTYFFYAAVFIEDGLND